jgi:extracellular factor (EF) 3-hydroxypalmitic acid methyl ester biosynthesis protein
MSSAFMTRTNLKPRGYVGDSEMMSMLYDNDYLGNSIFSKLMHKHPVEHPAAQAVRNRRVLIPVILKQVLNKFPDLPSMGFKILSVACGPAVELQDLLISEQDFNTYNFTLIDQDKSALFEAAKGIEKIERHRKKRARVTYLKDSVRTILASADISEKWGRYHYIYSMGLFDYLTPPVAEVIIRKLYDLLLPGGELLIGNYHSKNRSRTYMEYWCDWVLYYREEDELMNLLDESSAEKNIFFEESGSQMFLNVKKRE